MDKKHIIKLNDQESAIRRQTLNRLIDDSGWKITEQHILKLLIHNDNIIESEATAHDERMMAIGRRASLRSIMLWLYREAGRKSPFEEYRIGLMAALHMPTYQAPVEQQQGERISSEEIDKWVSRKRKSDGSTAVE